MTYLGGSGNETPAGIAVDGAGDAFVAGTTTSTNFPTSSSAYQTAPESGTAGTQHVFVTELDPLAAALMYSSYLSGNGNDLASGMTIDAAGDIFVTGTTSSSDTPSLTDQFPASTLPQALALQSAPRAPIQFFVTKVNTNAPRTSSISYSTYFGGANFNTPSPIAVGGGIAVDTNGNMYFTGTTNFTYTGCAGCSSADFPILNAYQSCLDQPPSTVFVAPCPNVTTTSNSDAFVAKLNPFAAQGQQLQWSTYLGGSQTDSGTGIALDPGAANIYITGTTNSSDFFLPAATGAFQACLNAPTTTTGCPTQGASPPSDAFVARFPNLTPSTTVTNLSLAYFSYLGGSGNEAGLAIAADSSNGALVTGWTQSADFPIFPKSTSGCFLQCSLNGSQNAFVSRINTVAVTGNNTVSSWSTYFGGNSVDEGTSIALDVNQNTYFAGDTNSTNLQVTGLQIQNAGGFDAFAAQLRSAANVSITGVPTLGTNQVYFWAGVPAQFTYTITNNGPDLATGLTLVDNLSSSPVTLTNPSGTASGGACSGTTTASSLTCPIGSLQAGSTATVTISVTPTAAAGGAAMVFNGGNVQVLGPNNIVLASTSVSANMSDFDVKVNPPNKNVPQAGDSASYQVQVTPHPVYGASVALACSTLPSGAACTFSPTSVTLQGSSPATATLTITTTARPITTTGARSLLGRYFAVWLTVPGLALLGIGAGGRRRRRNVLGLMLLCLVLAQLAPLPGCGGTTTQPPASGTPPGTWPITVSGTSGSDAKSQGIQLTVP